jgi:hypothetical protein
VRHHTSECDSTLAPFLHNVVKLRVLRFDTVSSVLKPLFCPL